MKKEISMIVLSFVVIIGIVLWFTNVSRAIEIGDIILYVCIIVLVVFALIVAFNRMKAIKSGLPTEDELSTKIRQKAAVGPYYTSLYWWLILTYFSDKWKVETHTLIGAGIVGMAILFGSFWAYLNFKESSMNNRIKELRARYNLTQDDLAKKVSVRRETIVFLEQGKYNPSLKLAHDIAKEFKVAIEEVFLFEQ